LTLTTVHLTKNKSQVNRKQKVNKFHNWWA